MWTKTARCCEINTCRRINLFVDLLVGICWSCRSIKASGCPDENWPAGLPSRRCTGDPSSRSAQRQTRHFLPRYATIQIMCYLTFCLQRKSRCTPCDLECMTEFSRRQTTGCVELFSLACYILITRAYERILPCMYCITIYVTQNAVCNCEIKSILTYLLTTPLPQST